MSVQDLQSDLLVDLSTEQQQDVSGGFGWGGLGYPGFRYGGRGGRGLVGGWRTPGLIGGWGGRGLVGGWGTPGLIGGWGGRFF
ncbi:hypothetical protein [Anabaena sp. CCY 0017]|uniref:hypothetical protein n=1 Tax=Anabaena sp. CCY 0017 TaxID=3103866 RepID=UPI0039C6D0EF